MVDLSIAKKGDLFETKQGSILRYVTYILSDDIRLYFLREDGKEHGYWYSQIGKNILMTNILNAGNGMDLVAPAGSIVKDELVELDLRRNKEMQDIADEARRQNDVIKLAEKLLIHHTDIYLHNGTGTIPFTPKDAFCVAENFITLKNEYLEKGKI